MTKETKKVLLTAVITTVWLVFAYILTIWVKK